MEPLAIPAAGLRRVRGLASTAALVAGAMSLVALLGCGSPQGGGAGAALETEDVTAKPDAAASLEGDAVAPASQRNESLSGQLPSGFPRDVPVPRPSSVVDFGPHSVTLEVQAAVVPARSAYERQLRGAGYASLTGGGWSNGAHRLRISYEERGGATWIRVEIPPGS